MKSKRNKVDNKEEQICSFLTLGLYKYFISDVIKT